MSAPGDLDRPRRRRDLAREFKTPLYVYSRERIESAYAGYEAAFARGAAPDLLRAQGEFVSGDS